MLSFLLHADDIYSVTQGQDNTLYPIVLSNHAVELDECLGVAIVVRHGLHHLAVPEDIIGQEDRAAVHQSAIHQHIIIGGIFPLITIDKNHIELLTQLRGNLQRRAHVQVNLMPVR